MTRKITTKQMNKSVGPCPKCGRKEHWFNNVPLTAYCYGPEENPHPEVSRVVPSPFQIYGFVGDSYWRYSNNRRVPMIQKPKYCIKRK